MVDLNVTDVVIPELVKTVVSVDRNFARQLVVAESSGRLVREQTRTRVEFEDRPSVSVVRSIRGIQQGAVVLRLPQAVFDDAEAVPEIKDFKWVGLPPDSGPEEVLKSYDNAFRFKEGSDDGSTKGLRAPQLGAVHAVLAHWSTGGNEPATVMMPTGTGKTDTMVAMLVAAAIPRLLILVPSDALRKQIASKFESLGILEGAEVVDATARRPVVGQVQHAFSSPEAAVDFASACNVVVATPAALYASDAPTQQALVEQFTHLFVDEAHHVEAKTWQQIRDAFDQSRVVQFTATPYREDGRKLSGRLVYAFPLREAQRRGYFSAIDYTSVVDFGDPDGELARRAITRLREDLDSGFDHILMARFNRIGRAQEVLSTYQELAPDLNPVVVYSRLPRKERDVALEALEVRQSRIVLCVDMLGEGFDLPSLKIAAVHDPHKSLGVTLQYIGRFARSNATTIGPASIFVGRPERDYDHRLRRLYAEDADWNSVISDLSERATQEEIAIDDFERDFANRPDDIPMRAVAPKMSTVVYRTACTDWNPDGVLNVYGQEDLLTWPIPVNLGERVLWFVAELREETPWANLPGLEEVQHHLFVIYWDRQNQRLYIHSSNKSSIHEDLAKALAGKDVQLIRGAPVYRAMADLQRLVPTNVGLLDVRNRNRRFQMLVGANVREGFPDGEAQNKSQTNIFASGFEHGTRVTVGASLKGRVWSYQRARSIKQWVDWCDHIGGKLANDTINLDDVMGSFIRPEELTSRPALVALGMEWPIEMWLSTSSDLKVSLGDESCPLLESDLRVMEFSREGPIKFEIETPSWTAGYTATIEGEELVFRPDGNEAMIERPRAGATTLSDFLRRNGPLILLEEEAVIVPPAILLKPNSTAPPFDPARLTVLDWAGIDLRKESQGVSRDVDAIQARAMDHLLSLHEWDVVIDDDGTGEVADLVALRVEGQDLRVMLVHCKYSSEDAPGGRVEDLYDVCGQTQKSIRWKHYVDAMFARLIRREQLRLRRSVTNAITVGESRDLYALRDRSFELTPRFTIAIAQPGLSKALASQDQLRLLAATDVYVSQVAVADLQVWCSA
jgi:superfamily II DNA or RNA helicase